MTDSLEIIVDGRPLRVRGGVTVASALFDAGITAFRASESGEPRAPLCGMGICYECRVRIDGRPHERSCLALVREGMRIDTAQPATSGHAR